MTQSIAGGSQASLPQLPSGALTFLFTDTEASTRLWEQYPVAMRAALVRHDELIERLVAEHAGTVVRPRGEGDSRFAVFVDPAAAVAAACAIQRAFVAEPWPTPVALRIRIAVHTGTADLRDGDYYGSDVNRCARLRAVAHGGQTLLSGRTADLVATLLPVGSWMLGLGQHRLKDLREPERIYQLQHPDLPAEFPPLKSLLSLLNNLPIQSTTFVGRDNEIQAVTRLVRAVRLLTLTGTGGMGKTRLALEVAAHLLDDFDDGVWLVELAPLTDREQLIKALASAIGVAEAPDRPLLDSMLDTLRPKQILILLDNCEHLIDASGELIDRLLRTCSQVRVLATSRQALAIAGEVAWPVPPLSVPAPDDRLTPAEAGLCSEAVQLFIERAVTVQPGFVLTESNVSSVVEVCRRLDGIPLAIELATARMRVLTVEQLAVRLEDRFRLLAAGNRAAPTRQQTLKALVDWSYDLLPGLERALFRRLSVFAGSFDLEAAEAVCPDEQIQTAQVLDLLAQLVDKSLVISDSPPEGSMRYRLLETLRQYGQHRLVEDGSEPRIRQAHAAYYLTLAERAATKLQTPAQSDWLRRLEAEHDNIIAALKLAADGLEPGVLLRFVVALWRFWELHGHLTEGRAYTERALATPAPVDPSLRAAAFLRAGVLAWRQGDLSQAQDRLERGLALGEELNDLSFVALVLNNLGNVAWAGGSYDCARALYERSLALRRGLGESRGVASCLNNLGILASDQGDFDEAWAKHEESLSLRRQIGDQVGIALSFQNLGEVALRRGEPVEAWVLYSRSLSMFRDLAERILITRNLEALARVAEATGSPVHAARMFGAAEALRKRTEAPLELTDKSRYERSVAAVRAQLGAESFAAAWAEGAALSLPGAIEEALAHEPLAASRP